MAAKIIGLMLFGVALFTDSVIALAQGATDAAGQAAGYMDAGYIADQGLWDRFVTYAPNWLVVGVPVLVALMLAFRGISEALWVIAAKTETKADDKVAAFLSNAAEILAKVTGMIGIGLPKAQLMAKAEKIAQKELASGEGSVGPTDPKAS